MAIACKTHLRERWRFVILIRATHCYDIYKARIAWYHPALGTTSTGPTGPTGASLTPAPTTKSRIPAPTTSIPSPAPTPSSMTLCRRLGIDFDFIPLAVLKCYCSLVSLVFGRFKPLWGVRTCFIVKKTKVKIFFSCKILIPITWVISEHKLPNRDKKTCFASYFTDELYRLFWAYVLSFPRNALHWYLLSIARLMKDGGSSMEKTFHKTNLIILSTVVVDWVASSRRWVRILLSTLSIFTLFFCFVCLLFFCCCCFFNIYEIFFFPISFFPFISTSDPLTSDPRGSAIHVFLVAAGTWQLPIFALKASGELDLSSSFFVVFKFVSLFYQFPVPAA